MSDGREEQGVDEPLCRIRVIGLGGAGCNIIDRLVMEGMAGVRLIAANTDAQALAGCMAPEKIQLGRRETRGLGAGGDPVRGRKAAEEDRDRLRELLSDADIVFLVAGLGGGTGTGAVTVVAELAREQGALTVAFLTEPFAFEGEQRRTIALQGLGEIRGKADAVVSVPNDKLFGTIGPQTTVLEAFRIADMHLCRGIQAIWRLLTKPGLVNVDFADVRTVLAGAEGGTFFVCAEGRDPDKVQGAISELMSSPFLERGEALSEADRILMSFVGGPDLALEEVYRAVEELGRIARPDALTIVGAGIDEEYAGRFSVTVLAARGPVPSAYATGAAQGRAEPSSTEAAAAAQPEEPSPTLFPLDEPSKGRFDKAEPTVVDGQDLDVPTYIRRGLALGR